MLNRNTIAAVTAFALVLPMVAVAPIAATAAEPIKIGFPIPLSGPTAVYGEPILKGAQVAIDDINAAGGVLGRKLELLQRDSKANPAEAVRLARELIVRDGVEFLAGTLTSAEAPAVSTIAKENHIVFVAPSAKLSSLTDSANVHPFIFRAASNTTIEGQAGAIVMAQWKDVKTLATIAPDYAYGHQVIDAFVAKLKQLRPDITIVDQQWPRLGESNFSPFITAQMSKHPDAVYCDEYAGDFISFAKQAAPLGYFTAIHNRLADGGEVGSVDETLALGNDFPFGIWANAYDPVLWDGPNQPQADIVFDQKIQKAMGNKYGSSWAIQGYVTIEAIADGIRKANSTDSAAVAKAMAGLTYDTPLGPRTFNATTHDADAGEYWGVTVKSPTENIAVIKDPVYYNPEPAKH
ncbi:ABC transporter substrate-binding protein [Acidisphaera sp. S103]|uniref:ABC transporter substrate-binding protein n=1 Tax=Acidisphaera sp. S103 TaxID=1747223 RepID=UPI00131BB4B0|nr:ABC transporter substrate-binding protein [Acidisphaera sp. S103]